MYYDLGKGQEFFLISITSISPLEFERASSMSASNAFGLWDIGFSLSEKNNIIINCGKHSAYTATFMESTQFRDVRFIDVSKHEWTFDNPNGHPDSLSFSGWWESYQMGKAKPKNSLSRGVS